MTPNDAQIDLLLRGYSRTAVGPDESSGEGAHLDPDELSAFAERALPPATSARYVSHLADCDRCRKLATQLTLAAGATVSSRVEAATQISTSVSAWQRLKDLFAVANLRYAAFAMVLVAAVGITFVALRRQRESAPALQARNVEVPPPSQELAVRQPEAGVASAPAPQPAAPLSAPTSPEKLKSPTAETSAAPPPLKEPEIAKSAPLPAKRADPEVAAKLEPSYAPPPPGERGEPTPASGRDAKAGALAQTPAQPKKAEDEFRQNERRPADSVRSREGDYDYARPKHGPSRNEANKTNVAGNEAPASTVRAARDKEGQSRIQQGLVMDSASPAPEERKVSGRTLRRQGSGAWIDKKFKSSMSVTDIKRNSEEFRALDSGLRTLAGQLSGEIFVVWKGKAYRIH